MRAIHRQVRQSILFSLNNRTCTDSVRLMALHGQCLVCVAATKNLNYLEIQPACFPNLEGVTRVRICESHAKHLNSLPPSTKMSGAINAIQRHELYVLEDGERQLSVTEDTKIPNAATIRIAKQDHTLGNMIRHQLLTNPAVLFAGYRVPHPLQPFFLLKIQTDGSIAPSAALERAAADLIGMLTSLESKFRNEFSFRELDATDGTAAGLGGVGAGEVGMDAAGGAYGEASAWSGRDYLDL